MEPDVSEKRFSQYERLGSGSFGEVFRAFDSQLSRWVAVKKSHLLPDGVPYTSVREIMLLKQLSHPSIVRLLDVVASPKHLFLVFELYSGDLKKTILKEESPTSLSVVKAFMRQMLSALSYLQSKKVIHRDINPCNILLAENGSFVLADFGLARFLPEKKGNYSPHVVTLWYRAPELLLGEERYSHGVDIWSLGCVFVELLKKKPPFVGDSSFDVIHSIFRVKGVPSKSEWFATKFAYPQYLTLGSGVGLGLEGPANDFASVSLSENARI